MFQDRVSSISMLRYVTEFVIVGKYSLSGILDNVKFSFLMGLKSNSFVLDSFRESLFSLSQSVTNFNSLLMTADVTRGFLLLHNIKLLI